MESSLVFSQFFSCDSDLFSAKPERIYTAGKFHTDIFCPCRIAAKRPQRGFAFSAVNDNAQNPCDNGNQHERNGECPDRPTEWFAYRWTFRQKWCPYRKLKNLSTRPGILVAWIHFLQYSTFNAKFHGRILILLPKYGIICLEPKHVMRKIWF